MHMSRARMRGLVPFLALAVSFAATLAWTVWRAPGGVASRGGDAGITATTPARTPRVDALAAADAPASTPATATPGRIEPLPPERLAELTEAGIGADDSEQRSLAIAELALAPAEQSLPALVRILRENRDTRSRISALEVLMQLPDVPAVRDSRPALLARLARDADSHVADAARVAATRAQPGEVASAL